MFLFLIKISSGIYLRIKNVPKDKAEKETRLYNNNLRIKNKNFEKKQNFRE
jgi:hypothetical protein